MTEVVIVEDSSIDFKSCEKILAQYELSIRRFEFVSDAIAWANTTPDFSGVFQLDIVSEAHHRKTALSLEEIGSLREASPRASIGLVSEYLGEHQQRLKFTEPDFAIEKQQLNARPRVYVSGIFSGLLAGWCRSLLEGGTESDDKRRDRFIEKVEAGVALAHPRQAYLLNKLRQDGFMLSPKRDVVKAILEYHAAYCPTIRPKAPPGYRRISLHLRIEDLGEDGVFVANRVYQAEVWTGVEGAFDSQPTSHLTDCRLALSIDADGGLVGPEPDWIRILPIDQAGNSPTLLFYFQLERGKTSVTATAELFNGQALAARTVLAGVAR